MSFHPPPQSTMVPPPLHVGPQGSIIPGYLPSSALPPGLPPPPMPPPFPAFSVPPPAQPAIQPALIPSSSTHQTMQPPRPQYSRKPNEPYDKRKDQFRPVSSSDKPTVTVFVGNITEHASDALIRQLLMKCGIVVNWKRVQGADGKLQAFGFCEYIDPEAGLRAIRLLHDLSVGEKNLVVKVDAKTKAMLEEYKKNKATEQRGSNSQSEENKNGEEELDEATLSQDEDVRKNITGLLTDNADVLSGKFKGGISKWKASHSGSEENLEGMGMDKDKKHLISREIRFFRDAYKDSEKDKKDRGKEDKEYDKDKKETRDNDRDRGDRDRDRDRGDRDRDRDRDRGKERQRERSQERDYERSRSNERSRDRSRSKDRDRGREDRDKGRQNRERDRELDEDEQYEKRKRERKQKERNQAFVERLKAWEGRERKKLRDYDREMEKDRELENEQAREKKHLLEFLEDYDDEQDDPKYYRGSSFDRRLQARLLEMETDDKDRKRELEEIEEIRKRLGEEAVVEEEEAMEEEPVVEIDPEPRPTLQATFKPAVHVVEAAPNIPSPAYESPKNSPKVNAVNKTKSQEENLDNTDGETATKKTFLFEMKTKAAVGSSSSNRKKLEAVFNSEEDTTVNKGPKRKLVPLDYSEEEMKAVGNAAAKSAEDKKRSIKSLIERIPTAKVELFAYSLDWECVDQTLIDRRIRPWVNKKIVEYIGEEEPSLVDFMCSKLLARSQPENILRDVSMVLDDEAEVFVVKMWRLLIYETEAKKIGLVK